MRLTVLALCIVAAVGSSSYAQGQGRTLRVAVVNTPDVLLNELIPTFEQVTGYKVTLDIGEEAFDVARAGRADLVIAHYGHRDTRAFMEDGLGRWPRMVFANQAALVGPSSDPAGIRGLPDAATAIGRIAERGGEFLVNNAATERYLADVLWRTAGSPAKSRWQIDLQLRDQTAIERAAERGAYTLWGVSRSYDFWKSGAVKGGRSPWKRSCCAIPCCGASWSRSSSTRRASRVWTKGAPSRSNDTSSTVDAGAHPPVPAPRVDRADVVASGTTQRGHRVDAVLTVLCAPDG
jgi:hypothetical protein